MSLLALTAGATVHVIAGTNHEDVLGHPETLGRIVAFVETVEGAAQVTRSARERGRSPPP